MIRRRSARDVVILSAVVLVSHTASAAEPTKRECVDANSSAQDLRAAGKVREARERLVICIAESCPGVVREDCAKRLDEVDRAMPTIVFEAKDGAGNDLSAVRVTVDGHAFADRLDGTAIPIDPGPHDFVLEAAGLRAEKTLVLREGNKWRRERIVLGVPLSGRQPKAAPEATSSASGPRTLGLVVGSAGIVSLAIGSAFGFMAISKWSSAKNDCGSGCGPSAAAQSEKSDAQNAATISTVGFVAGAALVAGGLTLFLVAPSGSNDGTGLRLVPTVGAGCGGVLLRGGF